MFITTTFFVAVLSLAHADILFNNKFKTIVLFRKQSSIEGKGARILRVLKCHILLFSSLQVLLHQRRERLQPRPPRAPLLRPQLAKGQLRHGDGRQGQHMNSRGKKEEMFIFYEKRHTPTVLLLRCSSRVSYIVYIRQC